MAWTLNSDRPIFIQIVEKIQLDIISGVYQPGDKLPSVRDLAEEASVNPNTMQKAFTELERSGLVVTQRTTGRFITENKEAIVNLKAQLVCEKSESLIRDMKKAGFSKTESVELFRKLVNEKYDEGENE